MKLYYCLVFYSQDILWWDILPRKLNTTSNDSKLNLNIG